MDYLVYAYLQSGRDNDAALVIRQLKNTPKLDVGEFKIAYASTAMPIRYAVERGEWVGAAGIVPADGAPLPVVAIAVWARGLGLARTGHAAEARTEIDRSRLLEEQLRTSGDDYWATQVGIMKREVMAWSAQANGIPDEAAALMRASADEEDAIEKLPLTSRPIVPAREQLGRLLLEQNHPALALKELETALANAPGGTGHYRPQRRLPNFPTRTTLHYGVAGALQDRRANRLDAVTSPAKARWGINRAQRGRVATPADVSGHGNRVRAATRQLPDRRQVGSWH
jgi:hypothetical protein